MLCRAIRSLFYALTWILVCVVVVFLQVILGELVFMWWKVENRAPDFDRLFAKARLDFERNPTVVPYGHWVYGIVPGNHSEWYKNDRVFLAEHKYDADEMERRLREGMVRKAIGVLTNDNTELLSDVELSKFVKETVGEPEEPQIPEFKVKPCEETTIVSCLPPFKKVDFPNMEKYMVVPRESLVACIAPTSFKRHLETMMCFLSDPKEFRKQHKQVRIERERRFGSRLCRSKPRYSSLLSVYGGSETEAIYWNHVMLHENPGERFVNAYIQACIENDYNTKTHVGHFCWECEEDMVCFMERIFARMVDIDQGKTMPEPNDYPFLPQSWFCRLHENFGLYSVIQLPLDNNDKANMTEKISNFLQVKGVMEDDAETAADSFHWELRKYEMRSAEIPPEIDMQKFYMYQMSVSVYMKRFLLKMYYYDYLYFQEPLPEKY